MFGVVLEWGVPGLVILGALPAVFPVSAELSAWVEVPMLGPRSS